MNSHLVLWTQSSYIRIFNIGSEIKQVGQSRRFEDSKGLIGNLKSCSINAAGKKVGIVSNKASTSGSSVNHSFHVYDSDSDSFLAYDLGEEKIPVAVFWDKKESRYFGVQAEVTKTSVIKNDEEESEDTDQ